MYARQLPGGKEMSEQPSPDNGWTKTVYKRDGKRAADIILTESPSPRNNWNKVVVSAGDRPISVVVIDWQVLPN